MINDIVIGAYGKGRDQMTSPPERLLSLDVVAGEAFLYIHETTGPDGNRVVQPTEMVRVSATSLRRALNALIDEDRERCGTQQ